MMMMMMMMNIAQYSISFIFFLVPGRFRKWMAYRENWRPIFLPSMVPGFPMACVQKGLLFHQKSYGKFPSTVTGSRLLWCGAWGKCPDRVTRPFNHRDGPWVVVMGRHLIPWRNTLDHLRIIWISHEDHLNITWQPFDKHYAITLGKTTKYHLLCMF